MLLPVDDFGLSPRDNVLPVVPLFHANAWSLAFSAPHGGRGAGHARAEARRRLRA